MYCFLNAVSFQYLVRKCFFSSVCGPCHMHSKKQCTVSFFFCAPCHMHTEKQRTVSVFFCTPGHMHTKNQRKVFFILYSGHIHTFWLCTYNFYLSLSRRAWMFFPPCCLLCAKLFVVVVDLLWTDFPSIIRFNFSAFSAESFLLGSSTKLLCFCLFFGGWRCNRGRLLFIGGTTVAVVVTCTVAVFCWMGSNETGTNS